MISVENVSKYFGQHVAVDNIAFNVGKGEIVGFLGVNGAGKTTTLRMIAGSLYPSYGKIWVGGYDMTEASFHGRRLLGYLPETVPIYPDMTTREYLEFLARIRGMGRRAARSRVSDVVERCSLGAYANVVLRKQSRGFQQRVGLAQAIVHDPEVLILDEPTIGIDPVQVAEVRALIRELGTDHTVLLSSHILPEVSAICERVAIIHQGRIVAQDRITDLSSVLNRQNTIRVKVLGPVSEVTECLQAMEMVEDVSYEDPFHLVFPRSGQEPQAAITQAIVGNGWSLVAMETIEMSLEDIFLDVTAEKSKVKQ